MPNIYKKIQPKEFELLLRDGTSYANRTAARRALGKMSDPSWTDEDRAAASRLLDELFPAANKEKVITKRKKIEMATKSPFALSVKVLEAFFELDCVGRKTLVNVVIVGADAGASCKDLRYLLEHAETSLRRK